MSEEKIKIRYLKDIDPLERHGDWIDLRAAEDVFIPRGEYTEIPLGIAIELPPGYEAIIAPRSSTFKHYGIIMTGSIGVIDHKYCGDHDEWKFPALCLSGKRIRHGVYGTEIFKGDRICQFRIQKIQPDAQLVEVERLGNPDRGGLGSTGR